MQNRLLFVCLIGVLVSSIFPTSRLLLEARGQRTTSPVAASAVVSTEELWRQRGRQRRRLTQAPWLLLLPHFSSQRVFRQPALIAEGNAQRPHLVSAISRQSSPQGTPRQKRRCNKAPSRLHPSQVGKSLALCDKDANLRQLTTPDFLAVQHQAYQPLTEQTLGAEEKRRNQLETVEEEARKTTEKRKGEEPGLRETAGRQKTEEEYTHRQEDGPQTKTSTARGGSANVTKRTNAGGEKRSKRGAFHQRHHHDQDATQMPFSSESEAAFVPRDGLPFFTKFPTFKQATVFLNYLVETYQSSYITRHRIGTSHENETIYAYRLGGILKQAKLALEDMRGQHQEEAVAGRRSGHNLRRTGRPEGSLADATSLHPKVQFFDQPSVPSPTPHKSERTTSTSTLDPLRPLSPFSRLIEDSLRRHPARSAFSPPNVSPRFRLYTPFSFSFPEAPTAPSCPPLSAHLGYLSAFDAKDSSEVLITALHHAREPISLTALLYTMAKLLRDFCLGGTGGTMSLPSLSSASPSGKAVGDLTDQAQAIYILMTKEIWVVPFVNPDGYKTAAAQSRYGLRKNRRETCRASSDSGAPFMGESQGGKWKRSVHKRLSQGVDLNRNYAYEFHSNHDGCDPEEYEGPHPFSEPETQSIKRLVEHYATPVLPDVNLFQSFKAALNLHSYGGFWTHPWNCCKDRPLPKLARLFFDELKEVIHTQLPVFESAPEALNYTATGEADDWMLHAHNVLAMSPELGPEERGFYPTRQINEINARNYYRLMTVTLKTGAQLNFLAFLHPHAEAGPSPGKDGSPLPPARLPERVGFSTSEDGSPGQGVSPITLRIANTGLSAVLGPSCRITLTGGDSVFPAFYVDKKSTFVVEQLRQQLGDQHYKSHASAGDRPYAGGRYKLTHCSTPFAASPSQCDNRTSSSSAGHNEGEVAEASALGGNPEQTEMAVGETSTSADEKSQDSEQVALDNVIKVYDDNGAIQQSVVYRPPSIDPTYLKDDALRLPEVPAVSFPVPPSLLPGRTDDGLTAYVDYHILSPKRNVHMEGETSPPPLALCVTETIATAQPPFVCHCGVMTLRVNEWSMAPAFVESPLNNRLCETAIRMALVEDLAAEQQEQSPLLIGDRNLGWVALLVAVLQALLLTVSALAFFCIFRKNGDYEGFSGDHASSAVDRFCAAFAAITCGWWKRVVRVVQLACCCLQMGVCSWCFKRRLSPSENGLKNVPVILLQKS